MTSLNPKHNAIGPFTSGYNRNYDVTDQNVNRNYAYRPDVDRPSYAYNNQYANDAKTGQTKTGYKYTFYKDPAEYHYHSKDKDSLAFDSLKEAQQISLFKQNRQPSITHSPSFRRTEQKSRQFLDSISNVIESHRSKYSHSSQQQINPYQSESEEILFLKQKLIETHQKLLKELEQSNRLAFQLETIQAELEDEQKQNKNLNQEIERMKRELDILHGELDKKADKNQQKLRSFENKMYEESRRNGQLKDDLETMRNKMLETLMAKNNFEEQNVSYKNQLNKLDKSLQKMKSEIKQKDQNIQYLSKQLDLLKKKYEKLQKQCEERAEQIHQYSHLASDRQKALNSLQIEIKQEKEKNSSSVMEFVNLQAQHKAALKRLDEMEDLCEKYKGQIYWFQKNNQTNQKAHRQKLEKLTEQYNFLNIKYKQKEKQIQSLKRKPVFEAEKKKKNYEHTKQFVNRLENEQSQIGFSRAARAQSKGSGKGSNSKSPQQATLRYGNKSPAFKQGENPITHQPITHRYPQTGYQQQKSKYITMLEQVGDLQADLLGYNMEKKKILAQLDKIDDTKMKTKEMINRRRRLQDEANIQENKIKRVKQQLRKMKAL